MITLPAYTILKLQISWLNNSLSKTVVHKAQDNQVKIKLLKTNLTYSLKAK